MLHSISDSQSCRMNRRVNEPEKIKDRRGMELLTHDKCTTHLKSVPLYGKKSFCLFDAVLYDEETPLQRNGIRFCFP